MKQITKKLNYNKPKRFPLWVKLKYYKRPETRYALTESGITTHFGKNNPLPHCNHIEMSGFQMSSILSYRIKKDGRPQFYRFCVFPSLRVCPDDTRGSLTYAFGGVSFASAEKKEQVQSVTFDGVLTFTSTLNQIQMVRKFLPCYNKKALIEEVTFSAKQPERLRISCKKSTSIIPGKYTPDGTSYRLTTAVYMGENALTPLNQTIPLPAGDSKIYIVYGCESLSYQEILDQTAKREALLDSLKNKLVIRTPDNNVNQMLQFTKIRACESIFETKNGLMHSPGGGGYYAALWTNDQCEYANPLFAYLGYDKAEMQSENCYRLYAKLARPDQAIYTSIVAQGDDYWHGAGDRGDSAMYVYGLSRYLLTTGNRELATEFLPSLETAAKYMLSKIDASGIVYSDSDELENRFISGKANLSTACISYDALLSLSYMEQAMNHPEKEALYLASASKILNAIESYFGHEVEGYQTYRYCEEEKHLRAWICLPLTVGIFNRKEDTVRALLSDRLRCGNGILTRSDMPVYWDRSTLYAIRGMFYAGKADEAAALLSSYTKERLFGEHVPYPVEAYPEGNAAHLSAESALYIRIFTEGLLGYRPTGFAKCSISPNLPKGWNTITFENMHLNGVPVTITLLRQSDTYKITTSFCEPITIHAGDTISLELPGC